MRECLDDLYMNYYQAKSNNNKELMKVFDTKINEYINTVNSDKSIARFLFSMKGKAFIKNLNKVRIGEFISDIELAKMITSIITHSLIEVEKTDIVLVDELLISKQSNLLSKFISGEIDRKIIYRFYQNEYRD